MKGMVSRAADRDVVSARGQASFNLCRASIGGAVGLLQKAVAERVVRIVRIVGVAVIETEGRDRRAVGLGLGRTNVHVGRSVQLKTVPVHAGARWAVADGADDFGARRRTEVA